MAMGRKARRALSSLLEPSSSEERPKTKPPVIRTQRSQRQAITRQKQAFVWGARVGAMADREEVTSVRRTQSQQLANAAQRHVR